RRSGRSVHHLLAFPVLERSPAQGRSILQELLAPPLGGTLSAVRIGPSTDTQGLIALLHNPLTPQTGPSRFDFMGHREGGRERLAPPGTRSDSLGVWIKSPSMRPHWGRQITQNEVGNSGKQGINGP